MTDTMSRAAATPATVSQGQAKKSSFYLAMRILPKPQRQAMYEVYSFCRQVDDIADEGGPRPERLVALDRWRADIDALFAGHLPREALRDLGEAIRDFDLCRADFIAIIDGMDMDVQRDIRGPDWATLELYCDRVASAVGRLSVCIFGTPRDEREGLAHHLGKALQLTNILRDIDEDAGIGRLYLPSEALNAAGITSRVPGAVANDPRLPAVCAPVVIRARTHFAEAKAIMARCPRGSVKAPRIMAEAYSEILTKTVARGFEAPRVKVKVSKARFLLSLLRHGLVLDDGMGSTPISSSAQREGGPPQAMEGAMSASIWPAGVLLDDDTVFCCGSPLHHASLGPPPVEAGEDLRRDGSRMTQGTIHVIGAGLAGLAASVALAKAGRSVVLHESARHAGGRCRSYYDPSLDMVIDNGNHLLLSGNVQALAFLRTLGSEHHMKGPATAAFPFVDIASGERWTVRPNAGRLPWWIFSKSRRVPGSRARDYLAPASLLRADKTKTIGALMDCDGALYTRLWQPLLLAALNTDPPESSAALAGAIMKGTLGKGGAACRPLIAADGLGAAFVDPAIAYLNANDAIVRFDHPLRAVTMGQGARANIASTPCNSPTRASRSVPTIA